MAQQEAADQKLQAKQDTHTAADRQQQAEVHLNLYDAASVVLHYFPTFVGAGCCLLQVMNTVYNILNMLPLSMLSCTSRRRMLKSVYRLAMLDRACMHEGKHTFKLITALLRRSRQDWKNWNVLCA